MKSWVIQYAVLIVFAAIVGGCSLTVDSYEYIGVEKDQSKWVMNATELAADFWTEHNAPFIVLYDAPLVVEVIPLPNDRVAECDCDLGQATGTIHIRPELGTSEKHNDLSRSCVIAHEIGHALGLDHIERGISLMSPVLNLPGVDGWPQEECPWSKLDQEEFCRVLPERCS